MDNLKIKIKYGKEGLELEIDGDKEAVQEEWGKIKKDGLGNILGGVEIPHTLDIPADHHNGETPKVLVGNNSEYPEINNLVYKALPSSESEWIIVYIFYATEFKIFPVSSDVILSMYEKTKRKTDSAVRNLKNNLTSLVKQGFINFINADDLVITDAGVNKVREIVKRTTGKKSKAAISVKSGDNNSKGGEKVATTPPDSLRTDLKLNLRPSGKEGLKSYYIKFLKPTGRENFLIFVYYLERILELSPIGLNQIYTCFKEVDVRPPDFFRQTATNIKNKEGWIDTTNMNDIKVTPRGANHIEFDIKKKAAV